MKMPSWRAIAHSFAGQRDLRGMVSAIRLDPTLHGRDARATKVHPFSGETQGVSYFCDRVGSNECAFSEAIFQDVGCRSLQRLGRSCRGSRPALQREGPDGPLHLAPEFEIR